MPEMFLRHNKAARQRNPHLPPACLLSPPLCFLAVPRAHSHISTSKLKSKRSVYKPSTQASLYFFFPPQKKLFRFLRSQTSSSRFTAAQCPVLLYLHPSARSFPLSRVHSGIKSVTLISDHRRLITRLKPSLGNKHTEKWGI